MVENPTKKEGEKGVEKGDEKGLESNENKEEVAQQSNGNI